MNEPFTIQELSFWRGILRDHALLTRDNLAPAEQEAINRAEALGAEFEGLPAEHAIWETVESARELIAFQNELVRRATACQITVHLHIAGLQQMAKETEDFLRSAGIMPGPVSGPGRTLENHRLWLLDAALHSDFLVGALEPTERATIEEFRTLGRELTDLYKQAARLLEVHEGGGDIRPALEALTRESRRVVKAHLATLERLKERVAKREQWVAAPPLMIDHMVREERHYLEQLSM